MENGKGFNGMNIGNGQSIEEPFTYPMRAATLENVEGISHVQRTNRQRIEPAFWT